MIEISVVLPAYNEEKNIPVAVDNIDKYLRTKFKNYEIIVVDDGSKDKTAAVLTKLTKKYSRLKFLSHSINKGYGAALRSGFAATSGQLIFYTDSDNQYDIRELDKLLPHIKQHDIVAGYRLNHDDPLVRVIISGIYNLLIKFIFGLYVNDVDCSFKLYKKMVIKNSALHCDTGLIDAEILIKAKNKDQKIYQVGVKHYPRLEGKSIYEIGKRNKVFAIVSPRVPIEIFKEIAKYWQELT